jgi:hypothetical protein
MSNPQEAALLQVAQQIERAVDDELERIDHFDDDDLVQLRAKRLKQVQEMQKRKSQWVAKGHGSYQRLMEPKQFFDAAKNSERVVCHFRRDSTERCKLIDKHLSEISQRHFETFFCSVDVERLPMLAERFNVMMLPTIMLIEGGNTFHSIIGFDEFGGRDDFDVGVVEAVLNRHGMVNDRDMFDADQSTD